MSSALKLLLFFFGFPFTSVLESKCKILLWTYIKAAAVKSLKLLRDRDSASVNA